MFVKTAGHSIYGLMVSGSRCFMDKYIRKKLDGRYEVLELIGVGGMANVYKALDILEDKIVAVKILRDEFLANDEFVRRFKNESKAIAVLSHPNIVKVFDVSFTEKYQFIVMEHVNGITLKEYINQQGQINWKEAVHFTVEVLRALQHAHDKGIVHRDIKPQNIMLLSDGTIKVMDFGIARFARSETRTINEKAIGSVHYISPEQARGDTTDERTDIYSVGVMMFEMLTGRLPFEADSAISVAIKQISAVPTRPRDINPNMPEGLEEIIIHAMQKDPTKRYRTASEMLRDIDEFKRNPSIHFEYKYISDGEIGQNDSAVYYDAVLRKSKAMQEKKMQNMNNSKKIKKKPKSRYDNMSETKSAVVPIMVGVTLAFILATLVFVGYVLLVENPFAKVGDIGAPNIIDMPYDKLAEIYPKLKFEITESDYTAEYKEGLVYYQEPESGKMIKENGTIQIKVSKGISNIVVPELRTEESTVAIQRIREMGVEAKQELMYDNTIAEGYVVKTSPAAGTKLTKGASVVIYVSQGPEKKNVVVPDLTGLDQVSAAKLLESLGLKLGENKVVDSTSPQGVIVNQTPKKGEDIEQGTSVNIETSKGTRTGKYALTVPLPNKTSTSNLKLLVDEELVAEENIIPAEKRSFKYTFTVMDNSIIEVLLDGKQMMVLRIYWNEEDILVHEIVVDNTSNFEDSIYDNNSEFPPFDPYDNWNPAY